MLKTIILRSISLLRSLNYDQQYKEIEHISTKKELQSFQQKQLQKLLLHCYDNVPYYRTIFVNIGLITDGKVDLSKFSMIPILTKDIIRTRQKDLISKDYQTRKWFYTSSGGSTGEPINHIQDNMYAKWANATRKFYFQSILHIDEIKAKKILLWGSEKELFENTIGLKSKISNWLRNTIFLNSFRMSYADIKSYINTINSYKPDLIRGYAASLYSIAKYCQKHNVQVYSPQVIISAAEKLTSEMRNDIEKVFHTKLYNFYGSREVGSIAGECSKGFLHGFSFYNYLELVDSNNKPLTSQKEGKILITNLHNYSMPLIRYEIGDMATMSSKSCSCHSILPTYQDISGRITDHFIKKDGSLVPAEFFIHLIGVVCDTGAIKQFQVIQEDYLLVTILVVPNRKLTASEKRDIEQKIQLMMTNKCKITWKMVSDIPPTQSGKYLYTKSLLWGKK